MKVGATERKIVSVDFKVTPGLVVAPRDIDMVTDMYKPTVQQYRAFTTKTLGLYL